MWETEADFALQEGNVLDIIDETSVRLYNEIVRVHCMVCGEHLSARRTKQVCLFLDTKSSI